MAVEPQSAPGGDQAGGALLARETSSCVCSVLDMVNAPLWSGATAAAAATRWAARILTVGEPWPNAAEDHELNLLRRRSKISWSSRGELSCKLCVCVDCSAPWLLRHMAILQKKMFCGLACCTMPRASTIERVGTTGGGTDVAVRSAQSGATKKWGRRGGMWSCKIGCHSRQYCTMAVDNHAAVFRLATGRCTRQAGALLSSPWGVDRCCRHGRHSRRWHRGSSAASGRSLGETPPTTIVCETQQSSGVTVHRHLCI